VHVAPFKQMLEHAIGNKSGADFCVVVLEIPTQLPAVPRFFFCNFEKICFDFVRNSFFFVFMIANWW
jgi:hypothetical protein